MFSLYLQDTRNFSESIVEKEATCSKLKSAITWFAVDVEEEMLNFHGFLIHCWLMGINIMLLWPPCLEKKLQIKTNCHLKRLDLQLSLRVFRYAFIIKQTQIYASGDFPSREPGPLLWEIFLVQLLLQYGFNDASFLSLYIFTKSNTKINEVCSDRCIWQTNCLTVVSDEEYRTKFND